VDYPEWWEDSKPKNRKDVTAMGIPQTTSSSGGDTRRDEEAKSQVIHGRAATTHRGKEREEYTSPGKSDQWIFYCGTTDTMTHYPHDFNSFSSLVKTHIETASGELVAVQEGGSIVFSEKLKLNNCLYIPILSSKLLSISQITKELNCVVLMFLTFCLLQDILMKEIIGRGTERGGLYYVDEVAHKGHVMLAHRTVTRNFGYDIDVWDIFHMGTFKFYSLVYLLVTLSQSNVKLVYEQRIIELLFLLTKIESILLFY